MQRIRTRQLKNIHTSAAGVNDTGTKITPWDRKHLYEKVHH